MLRRKDEGVRARLVAQQFNLSVRHDTFAATPGLKAVRFLLSRAASGRPSRGQGVRQLALYDIEVAFFHAMLDPREPRMYMKVPLDVLPAGRLARLLRAMYGTRKASSSWQDEAARVLTVLGGFRRLRGNPMVFHNAVLDIVVVLHGDDYLAEGPAENLDDLDALMRANFRVKVLPRVGPLAGASGRYLGRALGFDAARGFWYEADPRHGEAIVAGLSPGGAKPAATPSSKGTRPEESGHAEDLLPPARAHLYQSLVGTARYLAEDRVDIQLTVGLLSRRLKAPDEQSWATLKRLGRYLLGRPSLRWWFVFQPPPCSTDVWSDADWGGDAATRRSTSAGVQYHGQHVLATWSCLQQVVAASSGESEFYAMGLAAAHGLELKALVDEISGGTAATTLDDLIALGHGPPDGGENVDENARRLSEKTAFNVKVFTDSSASALGSARGWAPDVFGTWRFASFGCR